MAQVVDRAVNKKVEMLEGKLRVRSKEESYRVARREMEPHAQKVVGHCAAKKRAQRLRRSP